MPHCCTHTHTRTRGPARHTSSGLNTVSLAASVACCAREGGYDEARVTQPTKVNDWLSGTHTPPHTHPRIPTFVQTTTETMLYPAPYPNPNHLNNPP